jgi:hypothetical protein
VDDGLKSFYVLDNGEKVFGRPSRHGSSNRTRNKA